MPAFQSLAGTGQKRKPDDSDSLSSRKKQTVESPGIVGSASHGVISSSITEQYWMVQWYATPSTGQIWSHINPTGGIHKLENTKLGTAMLYLLSRTGFQQALCMTWKASGESQQLFFIA